MFSRFENESIGPIRFNGKIILMVLAPKICINYSTYNNSQNI